jgi:hypothetical protein
MLAVLALSTACGSATASSTTNSAQTRTPIATVDSWFRAINSGDAQGAAKLFADDPAQTSWIPDAPHNAFTNVDCHDVVPPGGAQASPRGAAVRCTFTEAPGNWMGNPDSYWTISLTKSSDDRWLITTYGQP